MKTSHEVLRHGTPAYRSTMPRKSGPLQARSMQTPAIVAGSFISEADSGFAAIAGMMCWRVWELTEMGRALRPVKGN